MSDFARSLDEQIRRAIESGDFDDLPGKGKPLDLSQNPFEDPAWRMAFRMLRSNGHTLPWIETRQGIEAGYEAAVQSLARTWAWRRAALVAAGSNPGFIEAEWQRAVEAFEEKIADLNKRIFAYNLEIPSRQFERPQISPERELQKITALPN